MNASEEEQFLVFIPTKPTVSERTLRHFIWDNMCLAQLWDEEFPLPWERFPEPLPDSQFKPLAISASKAFLPDFEEEYECCKELASHWGYDVYLKKFHFKGEKEGGMEGCPNA